MHDNANYVAYTQVPGCLLCYIREELREGSVIAIILSIVVIVFIIFIFAIYSGEYLYTVIITCTMGQHVRLMFF